MSGFVQLSWSPRWFSWPGMQEIGRWFSFALKLVVTAPQLVYCLFHLMAKASPELELWFDADCQSIPRVPGNRGLALSCCNLRLRLLHVCEQQGCRGFDGKFPQRIPYRTWTNKPTLRDDILTVVLRDWERKCETSLRDVYSLWLRDAHLYGKLLFNVHYSARCRFQYLCFTFLFILFIRFDKNNVPKLFPDASEQWKGEGLPRFFFGARIYEFHFERFSFPRIILRSLTVCADDSHILSVPTVVAAVGAVRAAVDTCLVSGTLQIVQPDWSRSLSKVSPRLGISVGAEKHKYRFITYNAGGTITS